MRPDTTSESADEINALLTALDDYELADSRLAWARVCHCDLVPAQRTALEFLRIEREDAHEALLCALGWATTPPAA
jgi:hypothetical protein